MDTLKKAMRNYWLLSAFCIVMGGALIWKPGIFTDIVGLVVGGLMAVYGAVTLVRYFLRAKKDPENATGLAAGIIFVTAGVFIMVRPDFIPKVIALIFGCYMLISGVVNIQESLYVKGRGEPKWLRSFLPALLTALTGILLLINPLLLTNVTLRVLGVCLLVSGIMNISGSFSIGRSIFKRSKAVYPETELKHENAEFIDIE